MTSNYELKTIPMGLVIPKPKAKADFKTLGWGNRRGEEALIYTIPNHHNPDIPYKKGITVSEWDTSLRRLQSSGEFTKCWFKVALPRCDYEGGCNFTTIGGLFIYLGIAHYDPPGRYLSIS